MQKVAIPYDVETGLVDQHFGHAPTFKIYTVDDMDVTSSEVIEDPVQGHANKVASMQAHGVQTVICGGIGMPAIAGLQDAGIEIYTQVKGPADEVVLDFARGMLPHVVRGHKPGEGGCHHN